MNHLRGSHLSATTSKVRLRQYLVLLSKASEERLREEYTKVLLTSRNTMEEIAKQARDIQDGVLFGEHFRQPPQGVPYALLKAFQLVIALVCAVPILLEELQLFYTQEIYKDGTRSLSPVPELGEKYQLLKTIGVEIGSLMKGAERALIMSQESRKKEDIFKFFSSVGAHGLAMQMASNILQKPVYNNLNTAELYRTYGDNFVRLLLDSAHQVILYMIHIAKTIDVIGIPGRPTPKQASNSRHRCHDG